ITELLETKSFHSAKLLSILSNMATSLQFNLPLILSLPTISIGFQSMSRLVFT
ncbi:hypothetical protein S83_038071, partial [Arachis hypogaea]